MDISRTSILLAAMLLPLPLPAQQPQEFPTAPASSEMNFDATGGSREPVPPGLMPAPIASPAAPPVSAGTAALSACCVPRHEPELYFSADAIMLWLSRPEGKPLVINEETDEVVLGTRDLEYDPEWGPRIKLGVIDGCTALELDFFSVQDWEDTGTVIGDGNLRIPGDLAFDTIDFVDADIIRAREQAKVYNFEMNVIQSLNRPGLAVLAGFRWMEFDERFRLRSGTLDGGFSDYRIHADSRLWGAQVGARWRREAGRVGLEVLGKSGIFGTDLEQRTLLQDDANTAVLRFFRPDTHKLAFVNEAELTGYYRINNIWLARAGYDFMLVEGVARAAEQLDFRTRPSAGRAVRSGEAILHGWTFGLEARW